MKLLFLHNNFPAQYRWVAPHFARDKRNQVVFGSIHTTGTIPGIINVHYKPVRAANPQTHHYLHNIENSVLNGQAAYRLCRSLKAKGFVPDVVCAHAGWGPGHFIKEVYPESQLLDYFEWFYSANNKDFDFLPEDTHSEDDLCRLRMRNLALLTDLNTCDWGIAPTMWQWSQLPAVFKEYKVNMIRDSVNTDFMVPNKDAKLRINNLDLSGASEVISYVARGMEPYRGYLQFMQAASILQKQRKNLHILVIGNDRVAYGRALPEGQSYKLRALAEHNYDLERIHFPGLISYSDLRTVFQCIDLHVYLTVPFVLSWSMLEAMSAGALILASDTAPVKEVIQDGYNGLLVDFFDVDAMVARINAVLDHRLEYQELRQKARQTILEAFEFKTQLQRHVQLITDVANKQFPAKGGPLYPTAIDKVPVLPEQYSLEKVQKKNQL